MVEYKSKIWGSEEEVGSEVETKRPVWNQRDRDTGLFKLNGTCWRWYDDESEALYRYCPFQNVTALKVPRHKLKTVRLSDAKLLGVWRGKWPTTRSHLYEAGEACKHRSIKPSNSSPQPTSNTAVVDFVCPLDEGSSDAYTTLLSAYSPSPCVTQVIFRSELACDLAAPENNPGAVQRCVHSQITLQQQVASLSSLAREAFALARDVGTNSLRQFVQDDPTLARMFPEKVLED
jgi:hypothetical protein